MPSRAMESKYRELLHRFEVRGVEVQEDPPLHLGWKKVDMNLPVEEIEETLLPSGVGDPSDVMCLHFHPDGAALYYRYCEGLLPGLSTFRVGENKRKELLRRFETRGVVVRQDPSLESAWERVDMNLPIGEIEERMLPPGTGNADAATLRLHFDSTRDTLYYRYSNE